MHNFQSAILATWINLGRRTQKGCQLKQSIAANGVLSISLRNKIQQNTKITGNSKLTVLLILTVTNCEMWTVMMNNWLHPCVLSFPESLNFNDGVF